MGESEAFHPYLARQAVPAQPEMGLSDLAQELLLPLQAVRRGMALVKRHTPRAPELIKKIDATLQAMERIIDELHDAARPPSGDLPVRAPTGLAEICRAVVADASARHPDRTIVLHAHDEARGNWDGAQLRQVIRSLLTNALQSSAPDVPVEVSVIDVGDRVLLALVHHGQPIPADAREHLFDRFRRGAGEGLYAVKRMIEAQRGSVEVASDEVRTVFRITLPRQLED